MIEMIDEHPVLACYIYDYRHLSDQLRARCAWKEAQERLLANDCRFLKLAKEMDGQGMLFGIDEAGNPLITDRGDGILHWNKNYFEARNAVCYVQQGGVKTFTGYELFPHVFGQCEKGPEMRILEEFTGKPFVSPGFFSWVESGGGESIRRVYHAETDPATGIVVIEPMCPEFPLSIRGVKRLLRVRKPDYKFPRMIINPPVASSF